MNKYSGGLLSAFNLARSKCVDYTKEEISEDIDDETLEKERRAKTEKLREEVYRLREKYPVGTELTVLGITIVVEEIYSNYPADDFSFKGVYFSGFDKGFRIVTFPAEFLEKYTEEQK